MKSVVNLKMTQLRDRWRESNVNSVLSFIIPVYNEEQHIGAVVEAIGRAAGRIPHEVIVVDNGSSDASLEIAERAGATCYCLRDASIGAVRNFGVTKANGKILVFIDSDVYIQSKWGETITSVVESLQRDASVITGSRYGVGERPSWIEKYWIAPFATKTVCTYLNAGHLIVRRSLFDRIGGFDTALETGEDYEFCERARRAGAKIVNNVDLEVVHEGNPKTLSAFFRRERWHGRGDAVSMAAALKSKPALLSIVQAVTLAAALGGAMALRSVTVLLAAPAIALPIWAIASFGRSRSFGSAFWVGIGLYGVYFAARATAIVDVLCRRPAHPRGRVVSGRT